MQRYTLAVLVGGLVVASVHAEGGQILCGPQVRTNSGPCYVNIRFAALCHPSGQVGPWYLYWPLEAHFQVPAMPCYPWWPPSMGLPGQGTQQAGCYPYGPNPYNGGYGGYGGYGPQLQPNPGMPMQPAPGMTPPAGGPSLGYGSPGPANFHAAIQPASYYPQVPAYWSSGGW
jgi:hypothetical protein